MGSSVDIGEAGFKSSLNLMRNTIISMDLADPNSESAKEFKELVWQIMVDAGKPNLADYFPVLKRVDPLGVRQRMTGYFGRMFDVFNRIINDRLQDREISGFVRKSDMLDALLDLSEDKGGHGSVSHEASDLFTGGSETTSSTLEWPMAELLRNPDKLLKAQAELKQVTGRGNAVEKSDIARLPYLKAMVKETFRMHPWLPLLVPCRVGATVHVGGCTILEGTRNPGQ
ncbi:geraniol 8-hydroxylase-like [Punica granatum]|uniref:Geraniol 8-hydroxylase-like n=1 Tax=Punica granatum TaxID=22663 RepID=A0A218WGG3_PUNGR|nr:geraniol 8-hydroxylase-like [Punica granatum]OWM71934.1 hypothetical protein CDL15_Pgr017817 [Punica granatum]